MNQALTASIWLRTLDHYSKKTVMAKVLSDIIEQSDDPKVAEILDAYGLTFMEMS